MKVILTKGGEQFVNREELSVAGTPVYSDLFSLEKKWKWGISGCRGKPTSSSSRQLRRIWIAKMANGFADDLASAALLANNKRLLVAPAMNTQMWIHPGDRAQREADYA